MRESSHSKLDPSSYIGGHLRTLKDADGRVRRRDLIEQYAVPTAFGLAAFIMSVSISAQTGLGLLTLEGLFAAFLFSLMLQLLERAATWAEGHPTPGRTTSDYAGLLEQLSANAAYASLVCALAAIASFAASVAKAGLAESVFAGLAIGLASHVATTLLLIARRVFLLTIARLNAARTGSTDMN